MDDELKQAMELSLQDYMNEIKNELKQEPDEKDPNSFLINFKYNEKSFERRFKGEDKIADLKLFVKYSIRTFSDVELKENFPMKIYDNDFSPISKEGISKRQILWVKLK